MARELPKVRAAVDSSRQILEKSRDTLAVVLKHRDLIEPLVKSLPETAARLADDLPKLTKQFSAALRDTQRLKEMAQGLRETQVHLDRSVSAWPEVRQALLSAAEGVQSRRQQLDAALAGEVSLEQQLRERGAAERAELTVLRDSLEQAADSHAAQAATTVRLMDTLRWACFTLAGVFAALGVIPLVNSIRKPAPKG
jgi:hypothetical protein